jgi:hypothetical protein
MLPGIAMRVIRRRRCQISRVTFVTCFYSFGSCNRTHGLSNYKRWHGRCALSREPREQSNVEVQTAKAIRRSTRVRVEIPVTVTSLDRVRPFAEDCVVLIVSAQGCGFRSSRALAVETPIFLSGLPGGGSVTARVANCIPLGNDGRYFLVGAALYTHGNIWAIANPPEDWGVVATNPSAVGEKNAASTGEKAAAAKAAWPYNVFSAGAEAHTHRK